MQQADALPRAREDERSSPFQKPQRLVSIAAVGGEAPYWVLRARTRELAGQERRAKSTDLNVSGVHSRILAHRNGKPQQALRAGRISD